MEELTAEEQAAHAEGPKDFDLLVHKRHPKTGKVIATQPYRLFVVQGTQYFERPKGSGNLYFKSGEHAGRLTDTGRVDEKADHIEYKVAPTKEELNKQDLAAKDMEIVRLKKELESIAREQKAKGPKEDKKSAKDGIEVIAAKKK